ncbi:FKBP-type peptidyl-prolyl cis-trans isomerase [Sphingomonas sp. RP10(2022)]|uniref:Peptidyl-prolyl cis-trans isomerase n=1 Tax=Sphingomonas liriopis TaxID=2949094 RepID=A0A9X2HR23_9SPHN|nr:FKBP-type peptidyl-prolyl cis-trans isomerase [Sphingomonas liriopis]MCP3734302.1 FKBP-type peptidyl-prolyl cis-trans isomerase [Sphingomonas liriopis]
MPFLSHASSRLILAALLPLLAAPVPASAAATRRQKPRVAAPAPIRTDNAIIALPLTPVVPAGQRRCATTAPTGLGSTILRPGTGAKPGAGDVVLVNYIGYLASTGAVFDQGMRSPLPVNGVIPGFSQGLQTMARSGVTRFCIPAALGYGAQASGPIPANADLVFQVELLDFKTAAEVESMNRTPAAEPAAQGKASPQP